MPRRSILLPALLALAVLGAAPASARAEGPDTAAKRDAFLRERTGLMVGLGAWSALNVAGGTLLLFTDPWRRSPDPARRDFRRAFGAMALAVGLVNAAIAFGTLAGIPSTRASLTSTPLVDGQRTRSADVFVANVGADIVSVLAGAALWAFAPSATARGTGAGFAVQSGFLVGFDALGSAVYRY